MTLRGERLTQAALDETIICPVLLGRDRQLHALHGLAEEAASGRGHTVLVSGEAGIGKSRLVNELAESLERDGWLVVRGSCFERDRTVPYAPVAEMLRQVWRSGTRGSLGQQLVVHAQVEQRLARLWNPLIGGWPRQLAAPRRRSARRAVRAAPERRLDFALERAGRTPHTPDLI